MTDIERIQEIEKILEIALKRAEDLDEIFVEQEKKTINKSYCLDSSGNVIGLSLDGCQLYLLPLELLVGFQNLQALSIKDAQLKDYSFLKEFKGLSELDLSWNYLTDISILKELKGLTKLDLSINKLTDISILKELKKLTILDLNYNYLTDISPLQELKGLIQLNLDNNKLTDISALKELKRLTVLNLRSNQITDISPLKELKGLTKLDLSDNYLTDISPLKELKGLTKLDLSDNYLTDISPLKELKGLTVLGLRNNQIKVLPEWIAEYHINIDLEEKLFNIGNYIFLYDNPIETPPIEIVKQGKDAIKDYYQQIDAYGKELGNEAKVVIVGEGESGKTTLFKKLQDRTLLLPDTTSTLGVEVKEGVSFINPNNNQTISVNLWDFGGQEIQHQLHQYFITPDALYILVADNRKQNTRWDYWFQIIRLLGGTCTVLVVLNNKKTITNVSDFQRDKYRENFKELTIDEISVDFNNNDILWKNLLSKIEQGISQLPLLQKTLPKLWKTLRDNIDKEKNNFHYMPISQLIDYGFKIGFNKETHILDAIDYFHRIGIILHFKEDENLKDIVFLNPNWITQGLYAAINKENTEIQNGCFTREWIEQYWSKHPNQYNYTDKTYLLRLMLKDNFDICYKMQDGRYLVPMLLKDNKPEYRWNKTNNLLFRFQYPFMPEGIISRLIVRLHELVEDNLVWKEGVIFIKQIQIVGRK